jgi:glycosyltransferase involved in cell wall biosynthesis
MDGAIYDPRRRSPAIFAPVATIALNGRLLISGRLEGIGGFAEACFRRIVQSHPEHTFVLVRDRRPDPEWDWGPNVRQVHALPPARRPWLYDLWFDYAVPRVLRRVGADVWVSPDGFASRRTTVPQVVVMHDLNFLHRPEWLPRREAAHYAARFPVYARSAAVLATVSEYSRRDLAEQFGCDASRIWVIPNAPGPQFRPTADPLPARARWAGGRPYYLFVGSLHPRKNLAGLLEGFAAYRARGGEADLVVVGEAMWAEQRVPEAGVHWVGRVAGAELAEVMGAAEALVFLPFFEGFGVPVVEAFAAGTPVIASSLTAVPEVCGGAAAALVDPTGPGAAEAVAEAMLRLEREPAHRAAAVAAGLRRAANFSWDRSAGLLWEAVVATGRVGDGR